MSPTDTTLRILQQEADVADFTEGELDDLEYVDEWLKNTGRGMHYGPLYLRDFCCNGHPITGRDDLYSNDTCRECCNQHNEKRITEGLEPEWAKARIELKNTRSLLRSLSRSRSQRGASKQVQTSPT